MDTITQALRKALIAVVRGYQLLISPILGPRCRFHPSCSTYAIQALKQHTLLKAIPLIARRLVRCHPGSPGGCDPVPD